MTHEYQPNERQRRRRDFTKIEDERIFKRDSCMINRLILVRIIFSLWIPLAGLWAVELSPGGYLAERKERNFGRYGTAEILHCSASPPTFSSIFCSCYLAQSQIQELFEKTAVKYFNNFFLQNILYMGSFFRLTGIMFYWIFCYISLGSMNIEHAHNKYFCKPVKHSWCLRSTGTH